MFVFSGGAQRSRLARAERFRGMPTPATFAEDLGQFGAPVAGGAAIGYLLGFVLGALAQMWVADRTIPIDRWTLWGSGIGSIVGLVAVVYDG